MSQKNGLVSRKILSFLPLFVSCLLYLLAQPLWSPEHGLSVAHSGYLPEMNQDNSLLPFMSMLMLLIHVGCFLLFPTQCVSSDPFTTCEVQKCVSLNGEIIH